MRYNASFMIGQREISINSPVYFIADIASNHDADLEKAKELIWLAKAGGADAVKFQHFLADEIVSDYGFAHLGQQIGHQAQWKKSIYAVYKEYECKRSWNEELATTAKKAEIDFLTTPYDFDAIEGIDAYVPAYKIGSGDITWLAFISYVARKNKPVFIATGAAEMIEVQRAVDAILENNLDIVLMQCNTNYTGSLENFKYINLNVLQSFKTCYPNMILGLSDHTPGHSTVLGAIALGARVIEKHFTSHNDLPGPDHAFSMNPISWKDMVDRSRELELSLGTGVKNIEENEKETVILQRRCLRLRHDMQRGEILQKKDLQCLRPAPIGTISPYQIDLVLGKALLIDKKRGEELRNQDILDM